MVFCQLNYTHQSPTGLEPATYSLQNYCSTNWARETREGGDRTHAYWYQKPMPYHLATPLRDEWIRTTEGKPIDLQSTAITILPHLIRY